MCARTAPGTLLTVLVSFAHGGCLSVKRHAETGEIAFGDPKDNFCAFASECFGLGCPLTSIAGWPMEDATISQDIPKGACDRVDTLACTAAFQKTEVDCASDELGRRIWEGHQRGLCVRCQQLVESYRRLQQRCPLRDAWKTSLQMLADFIPVTLEYLELSAPGQPADRVVVKFKMVSEGSGLASFRAHRITKMLLDCGGISDRIGQYLPYTSTLGVNAGRCHSGAALILSSEEVEIADAVPNMRNYYALIVVGVGLMCFAGGCFFMGTVESAKMPEPKRIDTVGIELTENLNPDDLEAKRKEKPGADDNLPELHFDIHDLG